MGADDIAGAHASVEPQAFSLGRGELVQGAGLRSKAVGRVFGVQAHFDGMAIEFDLFLGQRQWPAFSHHQLPGYQVLPGDQFGDRVLYLQAGVHFQEVEIAVFVNQELHGTGAFVTAGQGRFDGGFAHGFAQFRSNEGRGRFFHDFLVPALDGAVSFAEVDGVAVAVSEDLDFHVPGFDDGFFDDQFIVAEGLFGFGAGPFDVVG